MMVFKPGSSESIISPAPKGIFAVKMGDLWKSEQGVPTPSCSRPGAFLLVVLCDVGDTGHRTDRVTAIDPLYLAAWVIFIV